MSIDFDRSNEFNERLLDLVQEYVSPDDIRADPAQAEDFIEHLLHVAGHLAIGSGMSTGEFVHAGADEYVKAGRCVLRSMMEDASPPSPPDDTPDGLKN